MSMWYRIDLTVTDYEGGEADIIEGAFRQIYIASNAPQGMALLSARRAREEGFSLYFTPQSLPHARALIIAYSAVAVVMPTERRLHVRVGDASRALEHHRAF